LHVFVKQEMHFIFMEDCFKGDRKRIGIMKRSWEHQSRIPEAVWARSRRIVGSARAEPSAESEPIWNWPMVPLGSGTCTRITSRAAWKWWTGFMLSSIWVIPPRSLTLSGTCHTSRQRRRLQHKTLVFQGEAEQIVQQQMAKNHCTSRTRNAQARGVPLWLHAAFGVA